MASRTTSAPGDSLDAAFGREQRVRVFHLLIDNIDTEHFDGTFDGYAGGEEQHILEKRLVRRLGRLELAKDDPPTRRNRSQRAAKRSFFVC